MNKTKIYRVNEYSKETGIGMIIGIFADMETIISYLTDDGHRHGILTEEFGDNITSISDRMVLKYTPEESELYKLLDRPQPKSEYYIVHEYDLLSK